MTARIEFSVSLVAGKQRHRLDRRHSRMYTPNETLRAERAIAAACREAMAEAGIQPLPFGPHEPVILTVDAYRPLPEIRPKSVHSEPDTYRPARTTRPSWSWTRSTGSSGPTTRRWSTST